MVVEINFPKNILLNGKESVSFFKDSFQVDVNKKNTNVVYVYHSIFAYLPASVQTLLKVRNSIVRYLGFSVGNTEMSLSIEDIKEGKIAGFLTIEHVSEVELVCASYEKNMDMWLSVSKISNDKYAISTLVNLKSKKGKIYMVVIKPFHKMIAKYCINQALKSGRI